MFSFLEIITDGFFNQVTSQYIHRLQSYLTLAVRIVVRLPPSSPPPSSHCACPSSFGADTWLDDGCCASMVRCRSRAAILVVLVTVGVVCHAEMKMPRADASDVKRCEPELASCLALLGGAGAKEATYLAQHAAIIAKTGTPSSASKGARSRQPAARFAWHARIAWSLTPDAARVRTASSCRAASSALVVKKMSDTEEPADGAEYAESNATSCAERLRECQAHSSARLNSIPGTPLSSRAHSRLCMCVCA
jgi:hypothetical protein